MRLKSGVSDLRLHHGLRPPSFLSILRKNPRLPYPLAPFSSSSLLTLFTFSGVYFVFFATFVMMWDCMVHDAHYTSNHPSDSILRPCSVTAHQDTIYLKRTMNCIQTPWRCLDIFMSALDSPIFIPSHPSSHLQTHLSEHGEQQAKKENTSFKPSQHTIDQQIHHVVVSVR